MKQKKSLLYWASMFATGAAIASVWAHLATSISIYEVRPKGSADEPFSWEFAGVMLATAINIFVILIAVGMTRIDDYIESIPAKTKPDRDKRKKYGKISSSLSAYLWGFGFLEIFGNVYFQIAGELDKAKFGYYDLSYIDVVAWAAVGLWGATPTLIAISGAKLMRVFSLDVYSGKEKEPSWIKTLFSNWLRVKLTRLFTSKPFVVFNEAKNQYNLKGSDDRIVGIINDDGSVETQIIQQPSRPELQTPEPYFKTKPEHFKD